MKNGIINFLEKKLLTAIVILILVLSCYFRVNLYDFTNFQNLLTNSITVVAIFIGVLMSMIGFLLTVSGKSVVKNLKKMNTHKMLLSYFMMPIGAGVFVVVLSIIMTTLKISNPDINSFISILWIIGISYFIIAFIRVIFLMYILLIKAFEEDGIDYSAQPNRVVEEESITQDADVYMDAFEDADEHF